ncbi:hypothetical protein AAMO2058_001226900 [Amorphochlora amoebiformis]
MVPRASTCGPALFWLGLASASIRGPSRLGIRSNGVATFQWGIAGLLRQAHGRNRVSPTLWSKVACRSSITGRKESWGLSNVPNSCTSVILFDGVCNFCNTWVNLVIDNDSKGKFCFAPLQSEVGKKLLQTAGRSPDDLSSFLLADQEGFWTESTAALRVASQLESPVISTAAAAFFAVPEFVRDQGYRVVADNRYNILGRIGDNDTPR